MKKILALSFLLLILLSPKPVFAKNNLETATDSNFNNKTDEFSSGQTIYIKLSAEGANPAKKDLNLRDNNYQLLKTYVLNNQSNEYTQSFAAPSQSGIYSLEAKIEGNGYSYSNVKTITVGNLSNNSSSNVDINVNVQGTKSQKQESSRTPDSQSSLSPTPGATPEISQTITAEEFEVGEVETGFFVKVKNFFLAIWNFRLKPSSSSSRT